MSRTHRTKVKNLAAANLANLICFFGGGGGGDEELRGDVSN